MLKTIEGFAVECSINKVWTSEALAWAVDEGVQVFGGNGYSREFPLERMYRDARITRIYEGTNEINRMLIPTRLLKQRRQLFSADGARAGAGGQHRQPPVARPAGRRTRVSSRRAEAAGDRAARAAPSAVYGDGLKDEQEVLAQIADVVIEIYATESGDRARREDGGARRRPRRHSPPTSPRSTPTTRPTAWPPRRGRSSRRSTRAAPTRRSPPAYSASPRYAGIDAIAARRRIADAVIEAGKYPL